MLFLSFLSMQPWSRMRRYSAGFGLLTAAIAAHSSVVITGTRIIYSAPAREVSVQIKNVGNVPSLIQVWLDRGDDTAQPGSPQAQTPFVLTPPIARLEPTRGQTIRLMYSSEEILPADRESLFYFNLLDIPPKPSSDGEEVQQRNMLQLAVRSRLKLFYRPEALKTMSSAAAWKQLTWHLLPSANNSDTLAIELGNPTPFYVNLQRAVALKSSAVSVESESPALVEAVMLAPFSTSRFAVPPAAYSITQADTGLRLQIINDYGGVSLVDMTGPAPTIMIKP